MNPKKENFEMTKLKVNNGVVEFESTFSIVEGEETFKPTCKDKYPMSPHQDMIDLLDKLKRPLARAHGLLTFETIMEDKMFGMQPVQKSFLKQLVEDQMQKINVTGVSISGQEKTRGVTITGTYDGMAINTRSIKFTGTKYGFEEELEPICDELEDELYAFIYEKKRPIESQLKMFAEGEEPEEKDDSINEVFPEDEEETGEPIDGTGKDFEEDVKANQ